MSKKDTRETVLLHRNVSDYRGVVDFCHANKSTYGSAANAAKVAIEKWDVYQDWKEARKEEFTAPRTRSVSGQFVADTEQKVALDR